MEPQKASSGSRHRSAGPERHGIAGFLLRLPAYFVFLGPLTFACYWLKSGTGPYRWVSQFMLRLTGSELPLISWAVVLVGTFIVTLGVFSGIYRLLRLTRAPRTAAPATRAEVAIVGAYAMAIAVLTMCPASFDPRSIPVDEAVLLACGVVVAIVMTIQTGKLLRHAPSARMAAWGVLFMGLAFCLSRLVGMASGTFAIVCSVGVGIAFLFATVHAAGPVFGVKFLGLIMVSAAGMLAIGVFKHPFVGVSFAQTAAISVAEAPEHGRALFYRFSDGYVAREFQQSFSVRGRHSTLHVLYAAPIVPEGWQRGDPVPAWAITRPEHGADKEQWAQPHRAGIRVIVFHGTSSEADAVKKVQEKFGLHSHRGAPILNWLSDPAAEFQEMWRRFWIMLGVFVGIWVLALLTGSIYQSIRRIRGQGPDPSAGD
jgi:hypothetical protein